MSYVSGFMMGAAIGKSIRQMVAGGGAPKMGAAAMPLRKVQRTVAAAVCPAQSFKLVSSLPGRRRYRVSKLSPELAKLLEEQLVKLSYVQSVQANPVSGSILLVFDEAYEADVEQLAQWLERKFFGGVAGKISRGFDKMAAMASSEAHAGSITRSIRNTARAFSQWIKDHTCGWFDMSSLASLLFLLRGRRKMMLTKQYPSGSQMLWWAVTLMRGWRTV
jgi:hypothetical protein